MDNCLIEVEKYAKETGQKFDKRKLAEYAKRFDEMRAKNPYSTKAEMYKMIGDIIETDEILMAQKVKAMKMQELRTRAEGIAMIHDTRYGGDIVDNMKALLTGTSPRVVRGGNRGVRAVSKYLSSKWMNDLYFAIEEHIPLLRRGALDKDLVFALNGLDVVDGQPVSAVAKKVASAFNTIMANIFDQKKAVNPFLERIQDYFVRQTHSGEKIRKAGFQQWLKDITATHGKNSFPDLDEVEQLASLSRIYDAITNDRYSSSFVKDPGNKAFAMTRERKLIPNDAASFYEYQQKYGEGNVFEIMEKMIRSAAHDIAVMERFGARPKENIEAMIQASLRNADDATKAKYENNKDLIKAQIETVLGFSSAPAKSLWGKVVQGVLQWEANTKLGGVYLSLTDDLHRAVQVIESMTGENPVTNIAHLTQHYLKGFVSKEHTKELGRYVDIFVEVQGGMAATEMGSIENAPGVAGRFSKFMSTITLQKQHQRAASTAASATMATFAADHAHLVYSKLPKEIQHHMLERYGITELDWNTVVRHGVEDVSKAVKHSSLKKLITTEGIEALPDDVFAAIAREKRRANLPGLALTEDTPKFRAMREKHQAEFDAPVSAQEIAKERYRISNSWGAMLTDVADMSSSSAGTAEFAKLHRGMPVDSLSGGLYRLLWLFKSASLKNLNTTERIFRSGKDPMRGNWSGVGKLVALGVIAYTAKRWAQDAINGKTPSDPSEPGFAAAALASAVGGGPGVDMLVHLMQQEYNQIQFKGQALLALGGPVAADALDLFDLAWMLGKLPQSDSKVEAADVAGKVARILHNTPAGALTKLPYTKSVGDYYILHELRRWGNPRYKRNLTKNLKESAGPLTDNDLWPDQSYFMLDPRYK